MKKLKWFVKQILPLKYDSVYFVDSEKYVSIWYQWFGKVYHHKKFEIAR